MDVSMVQKKTCFYPLPSHGFWGVFKHERGGGGGLLHVVVRCLTVHTVTGPCLWHCQSRLNLSCRISVAAREAVLDCFADANGMFQVLLGTYSFVLMIFSQNHFRKRFSTHLEHFSGCLSKPGTWWDTQISTTTVVIS